MVASAMIFTRTKRSSILVIAKVLHAVPTDLPNCMMAGRAVVPAAFAAGSQLGDREKENSYKMLRGR